MFGLHVARDFADQKEFQACLKSGAISAVELATYARLISLWELDTTQRSASFFMYSWLKTSTVKLSSELEVAQSFFVSRSD